VSRRNLRRASSTRGHGCPLSLLDSSSEAMLESARARRNGCARRAREGMGARSRSEAERPGTHIGASAQPNPTGLPKWMPEGSSQARSCHTAPRCAQVGCSGGMSGGRFNPRATSQLGGKLLSLDESARSGRTPGARRACPHGRRRAADASLAGLPGAVGTPDLVYLPASGVRDKRQVVRDVPRGESQPGEGSEGLVPPSCSPIRIKAHHRMYPRLAGM